MTSLTSLFKSVWAWPWGEKPAMRRNATGGNDWCASIFAKTGIPFRQDATLSWWPNAAWIRSDSASPTWKATCMRYCAAFAVTLASIPRQRRRMTGRARGDNACRASDGMLRQSLCSDGFPSGNPFRSRMLKLPDFNSEKTLFPWHESQEVMRRRISELGAKNHFEPSLLKVDG